MTGARYRSVPVGGSLRAVIAHRADNTILLTSTEPLQEPPPRITDRLLHWANVAPERTLAARRSKGGGDWVRLSYGEAWRSARRIAQALLDMGVSTERPVAVLSDNDLEHLLLALGALIAGVPYAPVSSAYSLVSQDHAKLRHVLGVLTPGLVFAADERYASAIRAVVPADTPVVLAEGGVAGRSTLPFASLPFASLLAREASAAVDAAHAAVGPDTVAKILFTSGSTSLPKGVINTQRMWCSNQQMILQCLPFLAEAPPVLVDWLVWNHTFGGNHNLGLVLYNGGTLYIDEGRPTPKGIAQTLHNLREVSPTIYFNVPKGFEEITAALEADPALCARFFSRLHVCYYAGAGLSQAVWDRLDAVAERSVGERIRMLSGLGMTETAPFALCANAAPLDAKAAAEAGAESAGDGVGAEPASAGVVGLPAPGIQAKLVPADGKLELRYKGPNVTPGYWRAEAATRAAFDEEGFFCSGDALAFIDPARPQRGLRFDGRVAEDFKLSSGTFVSVGPLRVRIVAAGEPCVQDAVLTGLNRGDVGALVFPRPDACRSLAGLGADSTLAQALAHPAVHRFFQTLADGLWQQGTGSATRVARLQVLAEPPSIDRGEVTDKGSINQRAVLNHRAGLVDGLYAAAVGGSAAAPPAAPATGDSPVFLPRH